MRRRTSKLEIRPLRETEVGLLPVLWQEAGLPYRPRGRDKIAYLEVQRSDDPDLFIGAFRDDKLVGVVIATDDGRKGWINRLAVHPSARSLGIGLALVKASEDALRSRGRRLFSVLIEKDNAESDEFFRKAGYKLEKDILYYTKREDESF